jgi:PAS domain S-box-containing protein
MTELPINKVALSITAFCSFLLGAVVITGWYLHATELIQVLPQFAPMQYNTALGFLLSGASLFALIKKMSRLALACGALVSLIGVLTLLQYIFAIDLAIDQLLMDAYITVKTSHPGRMAPNTALCFILTGSATVLLSSTKNNPNVLVMIETLSLLILAFSAMALAGYIVGEEKGYAWGKLTRMALHTTSGFIVLGLGVLAAVWSHRARNIASIPLWLPGLLCFFVLLFDMFHPAGVAIGVAYVPLVFFSILFNRKHMAFVFAGLATVLIILGYLSSPEIGIDEHYVIINRLLSIVAVWIAAFVVYIQKITQEKLAQSEEALALGWRGAGAGMWDWDIQTDAVIFSDRFKELLGYQPDEMPHHFDEWSELLHDEDKAKNHTAVEAHLQNNTPYNVEYRLMTKSGQWRWFMVRGQALWDAMGNPVRMAGSLSDITERKETEVQLRLLKLAIEHLRDVVVITKADPENPVIVFVNKASKEVCGYRPEEMLGRTPSFLQGEKTDRATLVKLKKALTNNQSFSGELFNYAKDGREYWIEIHIVPVIDEQGKTTHFAAIERDITQAKEAEFERERLIASLEKSNSELDDFAYVASHDLKAPLRVIENVSHWLEEDLGEQLDKENKENLLLLRSRVHRMDKLLDDLLEYSRIGRKIDANYTEVINGDKLIADITLLLAMPDGFQVTASAEFLQLKVNRMPLQLILLNLISNAIKHREKDTGLIEVSVQEQDYQYLFAVKDDGPGIDPVYHDKIFKMFQTLKPRDRVEGSGMGLAIIRKHIELFGGTISVDSSEGQGCTFSFTWPKQQSLPSQEIS